MSTPEELRRVLTNNPIVASLGPEAANALTEILEPVQVAAGTVVVQQGAADRSMYFVLSGSAKVRRGEIEMGRIAAGDHFGELGLVVGRPRAASIAADEDLELLRLTLDAYIELSRERPALALRFVEAVLGGVAGRLSDVSDSVGVLMQERSLPRRLFVRVRTGEETREVKNGTRVGDLLPTEHDGALVVAGLVDYTPASLSAPVSGDCRLEPLTAAHWEGKRIIRRSTALLLLEAGARIAPELALSMGQSLGIAERVRIDGTYGDLTELAAQLEAEMRRLAEAATPLLEEWWTVNEAREHFASTRAKSAGDLLSTWRAPAVPMLSFGTIYALRTGPALPTAEKLTGFRLLADEDGLILAYVGSSAPSGRQTRSAADIAAEALSASRTTAEMTAPHRRWLTGLGVNDIGQLNAKSLKGQVSHLIRVSEGLQEKRIGAIADDIVQHRDDIDIVAIAGPSSSGKSTFIKRLCVQLQVEGINPVEVSLDDYYVDREETPRDEDGEYDFEAFDALRLDLLRQHVRAALAGETVTTARFDFQAGKSHPAGGREITVSKQDLLILEGIHGLNEDLLANHNGGLRVFRIFINPLAQLPFDHLSRVHPSDLRLLRRIVRDRHTRGHDAKDTIMRWPSVRAGERRHIFPHQDGASTVFDSSLVYELSVLKVFAERYLLEVPRNHPAHTTAHRLLELVDRCVAIQPDVVPPNSILREFIGGSGFEY